MTRGLRVGIGLAIGLGFTWLTLRNVDWDSLKAAFAATNAGQIGLAFLVIALAYTVRIWRWRYMLRVFAPGVTFAAAAGPFLASFAINNLVPFRAGDVTRCFAFEARLGVAPSRVAATLIIERLWDLLALLVFFAFGLSRLTVIDPVMRDLAVTAMVAGALVVFIVLLVPQQIRRLLIALRRLPVSRRSGILTRVLSFGLRLTRSLRQLSAPRHIPVLGVLSLLSWGLEGGVFFAVSFHYLEHVVDAWFPLATGTLMTLVPGTPGHLGTFDFGAKLGFAALGMGPAEATVSALLAHVMVWFPVTAAGGIWLLVRGLPNRRKLNNIRNAA